MESVIGSNNLAWGWLDLSHSDSIKWDYWGLTTTKPK
jgi:hypothetical protein